MEGPVVHVEQNGAYFCFPYMHVSHGTQLNVMISHKHYYIIRIRLTICEGVISTQLAGWTFGFKF